MPTLFYLRLYLAMVPVFLAVDLVWLGVLAQDFYQGQIGHLLAERVNWPAALVFYGLYIVGIIYFAVAPALAKGSPRLALINGAMFGFFTYATYELTNLATLPDWPLAVVLVDILWGTVLCATVAAAGYWLGRRLGQPGHPETAVDRSEAQASRS